MLHTNTYRDFSPVVCVSISCPLFMLLMFEHTQSSVVSSHVRYRVSSQNMISGASRLRGSFFYSFASVLLTPKVNNLSMMYNSSPILPFIYATVLCVRVPFVLKRAIVNAALSEMTRCATTASLAFVLLPCRNYTIRTSLI